MTLRRIVRRLTIFILVIFVFTGVTGIVIWQTSGAKLIPVDQNGLQPVLLAGDLAVVAKNDSNKLKNGEMISFSNVATNGLLTFGRVIYPYSANNKIVVTSNGTPNGSINIDKHDVSGRVVKAVPYLGFFISFVADRLNLILLIYIPALGLVTIEARRLIRHYSRRTYQVI